MSCVLARARVLSVNGDRALVESIERGCGRCNQPGGCGGRGLESLKPRIVEVGNPVDAHAGDYVEVSVPSGTLLGLASRFYLLPLSGLVGGALLSGGEVPWAVFSSMAGATAGYLAARWSLRGNSFQAPVVVRICGNRFEEKP